MAGFLNKKSYLFDLACVDASPAPPTAYSEPSSVTLNCRDEAYRRKLEQGAREYYLEYLRPVSVINRILNAAESIDGIELPAHRISCRDDPNRDEYTRVL